MTGPHRPSGAPVVAVCLKWVELRPEPSGVDPGDLADRPGRAPGTVVGGEGLFGLSSADEAALEWALRLTDAWDGSLMAVTAGPAPVDGALRRALAHGANPVRRVDLPSGAPSAAVAAALAPAVEHATVVLCGDWSLDRGSGAVPAYLAAELGAGQALGLRRLAAVEGEEAVIEAERRLDGGRRERLRVTAPAVLSVEGGSVSLRRAALPAVLAAATAVLPAALAASARRGAVAGGAVRVVRRWPYRPRPRALAAPDPAAPPRDRILGLAGVHVTRPPSRLLHADPISAAQLIVDQLSSWGYLDAGRSTAPAGAARRLRRSGRDEQDGANEIGQADGAGGADVGGGAGGGGGADVGGGAGGADAAGGAGGVDGEKDT